MFNEVAILRFYFFILFWFNSNVIAIFQNDNNRDSKNKENIAMLDFAV